MKNISNEPGKFPLLITLENGDVAILMPIPTGASNPHYEVMEGGRTELVMDIERVGTMKCYVSGFEDRTDLGILGFYSTDQGVKFECKEEWVRWIKPFTNKRYQDYSYEYYGPDISKEQSLATLFMAELKKHCGETIVHSPVQELADEPELSGEWVTTIGSCIPKDYLVLLQEKT